MSVRGFAAYLGVSPRTVSKWEAGGSSFVPGPDSQALLDTALERASDDAKERFGRVSAPLAPVRDETHGTPTVYAPDLEPGMVDRSDELDTLAMMLIDAAPTATTEIVAVYGPGGFGKTTLAVQACHDARVTGMFSDVLWVETGEHCTGARVVQLIADLCVHLDGTRPALLDPDQAGFHLAQVLGDRWALLVIDNVWSASDLAPFIMGGPNCVRLVTTRNARVCPSHATLLRLGPMNSNEVRELLHRTAPSIAADDANQLAELCGGWPLLATVVGSNIGQEVAAGASAVKASTEASEVLTAHGPQAFDVWDADQRRNAIGQAITSSLDSLHEHVSLGAATDLRERYLSLGIFPSSTPIPLPVLSTWWGRAHGWPAVAVRQFCRLLADRSLISVYQADRDAILVHDIFRSYLRHLLADRWPTLHQGLVDAYRPHSGRWADLGFEHEYMWRFLPYHLHEAAQHRELIETVAAPAYVVNKAWRFGFETLTADRAAVRAVDALNDEMLLAARDLTAATHLLHDLDSPSDIASTLLASVMRSRAAPEQVGQLRRLFKRQDALDTRWALPGVGRRDINGDSWHVGAVTSVATNGTLVMSGGEDGVVRMRDADAGRLLHSSRGHTGWVYATALSADGQTVASAGDDGLIRLWRRDTGEPIGVLVGHKRRVRALTFAAVDVLVSGAEDGRVCLWDSAKRRLVLAMNTPGCPVWSVAVNSDSTLVAVTGEDEFLRVYDLRSGELVDEKAAHHDWVRSVAFAGDAPRLATGSGDRTVRVWSIATGRLSPVTVTDELPARVRAVALSPDGTACFAAGEDATIRVFSANGGLVSEKKLPDGIDWIRALSLAPGERIIAGCEDGSVRAWSGLASDELTTLSSGANTVWSTAFDADGSLALLGRGDGVIDILHSRSGELVETLTVGLGRVWSLACGAGVIAAACGDGTIHLRSVNGDANFQLNRGEPRTWAVAVDRSGSRVAGSCNDGTVRVWNASSARLVREIPQAHPGRIRSMAFDETGELLLTGGGDGTVRLWRIADGNKIEEFTEPARWVRAVALDRPGNRVAIGAGDGLITLHDRTGSQKATDLLGHSGRVLLVSFTNNPDRLVSAAADGTVRTWSVTEARQIAQTRLDASLQCAAFSLVTGAVLAGSAAGVTTVACSDLAQPADRD
jgi:WD40 repeat protein